MTFEIEIGGRSRSVTIQRMGSASRYRVIVDGRTHVVDARRSGEFGLLLAAATFPPKVTSALADNSYEDTGLAPPSDEPGRGERQKRSGPRHGRRAHI